MSGPVATPDADGTLVADILVIGGGPAGCWAALSAAEAGATVVLAEKGYVGTSGPTAAGNSTIIHTAPGSDERAGAIARRVGRGMGLVAPGLVDRVLEQTYQGLNRLADWGYGFPRDDEGRPFLGSMRGPDYLRFMRQRLIKSGVKILDQSPVLHLLRSDGVVAGARGFSRVTGAAWSVKAGAVVLATGGCAFLSGALGTNNLTGDGYLMAAEAGAVLSSMEFTGQYGISPAHSSLTKGIMYFWASFYDADHRLIEEEGDRQEIVARHLLKGPVYAVLDKAPPRLQEGMRRGQPNIFMPFDRRGIDPFTQKFAVTLLYEGTVRGTGGLLIDDAGATNVSGLYAAGDAAARDAMAGATSGGGGPNASWALATGTWSGAAAARFARNLGPKLDTRQVETVAPSEPGATRKAEASAIVAAVQREVLPIDRNFFRTADGLARSARALDEAWSEAGISSGSSPREREAGAMLATARWMVASARVRNERRGIHRRTDAAIANPALARPIRSGGLAEAWATFDEPLGEAAGP